MIKILEILEPQDNLSTPNIWTIEVLGSKREDILVLKDVIDDHSVGLLSCKGIHFNRGFPSFELGAKLFVESFSTLPKQEITRKIKNILNKIVP